MDLNTLVMSTPIGVIKLMVVGTPRRLGTCAIFGHDACLLADQLKNIAHQLSFLTGTIYSCML